MRVVLYAEGTRELSTASAPNPGVTLGSEQLGPAHLVVRRVLEDGAYGLAHSIAFQGPLRIRGRVAKGSDLHRPATLRRLLAWLPKQRPDLAIVLVDCDGDKQRATQLEQAVGGLIASIVIGVAVQEFEAWLLADHEIVLQELGIEAKPLPKLERMKPNEAKDRWASYVGRSTLADEDARRAVASALRLEIIRRHCSSFERFCRAVRAVRNR